MDNLDFSEEEIQQQLVLLGYSDVPKHRLREFKRDLEQLIQNGVCADVLAMDASKKLQPRPPAFTKEKVSSREVGTLSGSFSLHGGQHNTQVLNRLSNKDAGVRVEQQEAEGSCQHGGAPHTLVADTRGSHFIKRKVLRKRQGQSLVCDESIYGQDSDCSSTLLNSLSELRLREAQKRQGSALSNQMEAGSISSLDSFRTCSISSRSHEDLLAKPKSFIRPVLMQPNIKKTDPVARYFQYKQLWDELKLPGEQDHRQLRWEIRERLAYQLPAPKARRSLALNGYMVPTDKKRSALRWQVRNLLA